MDMQLFQSQTKRSSGDPTSPQVMPVLKREAERFLLGVVMEPGVADAHGHVTDAVEVRKAAHRFMAGSQTMGLMHQWQANDAVTVLESYILPEDAPLGGVPIRKGTWLLGVRIEDDGLWAQVQRGELTGFSIGGYATEGECDTGEQPCP